MLDYSQLALLLNQMHLNLNRDQIDTVMNILTENWLIGMNNEIKQ